MATYLVTGAAGFIASKVCELLLTAGHTVVGIDNLNDYYDIRLKDWRLGQLLGESDRPFGGSANISRYASDTKPLKHASGHFIFYYIDIENAAALDTLFAQHAFAAVFNLAARAGVRYSTENPHVYLSTNTMGTLNLLDVMRKYHVPKIVQASTSSLYAGCAIPFTEDLPVNTPLSPYAASKKSAELFAYTYHKLYGIDVTVVRYFTVFGPAGRPDMAPFRFLKWIDEGTAITLYGDGSQSRDFTYVDDIAAGTILAAKKVGFEIVNLGGGKEPVTINAVIGLIEDAVGRKAVISHHPFHIADVQETAADIHKANRILGWTPQVSLSEGIARTAAWYFSNQSWVRRVNI